MLAKEHGHVDCADWLRGKLSPELANEMDDTVKWDKQFVLNKEDLLKYLNTLGYKLDCIAEIDYSKLCEISMQLLYLFGALLLPNKLLLTVTVVGHPEYTSEFRLLKGAITAKTVSFPSETSLPFVRGLGLIQLVLASLLCLPGITITWDNIYIPKLDTDINENTRVCIQIYPSYEQTTPLQFDVDEIPSCYNGYIIVSYDKELELMVNAA